MLLHFSTFWHCRKGAKTRMILADSNSRACTYGKSSLKGLIANENQVLTSKCQTCWIFRLLNDSHYVSPDLHPHSSSGTMSRVFQSHQETKHQRGSLTWPLRVIENIEIFSLFEENYKYLFPMETVHILSVLKSCNNLSGSWIHNGILVLLRSCCSAYFTVLCYGWGLSLPFHPATGPGSPSPLCLCSAEEKARLGIRWIWKHYWRLHLHQALQSI